MDKLEKRLAKDASRIDAQISPELDKRISASLRGLTPVQPAGHTRPAAPRWAWLAGSIGAAAALTMVAIITLRQPQSTQPPVAVDAEQVDPLVLPDIDLVAETTELVSPLSAELDALRTDLEKARQFVRNDIGI